jgi:biopolymer transport protein ExbD
MGLKRRNKINAQFSMSSLTDIIFLLLIFFMLTSSLIVPNALNLKLPGESSSTTISSRLDEVTIQRNGRYYVNGQSVRTAGLYAAMRQIRKKGKNTNIVVSAHPQAPNQSVVEVLDAARKLKLNAILSEAR